MITLTKEEFEVLREIEYIQISVKNEYYKCQYDNAHVTNLATLGLVATRAYPSGISQLEVAMTELGNKVLNNEIEYKIIEKEPQEMQYNEMDLEFKPIAQVGEITIDTGIPLPKIERQSSSRKRMLPIEHLQVGESFLIPFKDGECKDKGKKRIVTLISQTKRRILGKDCKYKFVTAIMEDGYRIWRKS